jgi:hypothetical protein
MVALRFVVLIAILSGCASTTPSSAPRPRLSGAALDDVRRVVVVTSGESRFAVLDQSKEPGREFDEVVKWLPFKEIIGPIARAVYSGVTALINGDRASATVPKDVSPGAVVADAFARTLQVSGPFNQIAALDREPVGDERRQADAIVRLSVPSWGLMRVREGSPDLVAGFADVRAQMVLRETGVVIWEYEEDITHPQRLTLDAFTHDRALTRQELVDVLERAGRRLANELVYARGGAR